MNDSIRGIVESATFGYVTIWQRGFEFIQTGLSDAGAVEQQDDETGQFLQLHKTGVSDFFCCVVG